MMATLLAMPVRVSQFQKHLSSSKLKGTAGGKTFRCVVPHLLVHPEPCEALSIVEAPRIKKLNGGFGYRQGR